MPQTAEGQRPTQSPRAQDLVQGTMRTMHRVDMSRQESNLTDNGAMVGAVEVHVPPRPMKGRASSEHAAPRVRRRPDIRRYLGTASSQEFEIARDDTASVAGPDAVAACSREAPGTRRRQPLWPLTQSALNQMQDELAAQSDSSSEAGPAMPLLLGEARTDNMEAATTLRHGQHAGAHDGSTVEEDIQQASPWPSPRPTASRFDVDANADDFSSPLQAPDGLAMLMTPPSSDPIRGQGPRNAPFGSQTRRGASGPRPGLMQQGTMARFGGRAAGQGVLLTPSLASVIRNVGATRAAGAGGFTASLLEGSDGRQSRRELAQRDSVAVSPVGG